MTFRRALALAQSLVSSLEELALKPKEGRLIWEVKGAGQEVWLDARTGQVLRIMNR
ncbi:MAG: PepSY domain-containing protein [Thermaceae bacterium]|nr:PepSY domain-containing protein [Thermaceae bacterium]